MLQNTNESVRAHISIFLRCHSYNLHQVVKDRCFVWSLKTSLVIYQPHTAGSLRDSKLSQQADITFISVGEEEGGVLTPPSSATPFGKPFSRFCHRLKFASRSHFLSLRAQNNKAILNSGQHPLATFSKIILMVSNLCASQQTGKTKANPKKALS